MQSQPPAFPFQQILSMALQVPRQHIVSLFKLGWPFLILMIAFYSPEFQNAYHDFTQKALTKEPSSEPVKINSLALTLTILATLVLANMAMLTYRKILLNTTSSWFDAFKLKARLAPFLVKGLQVGLSFFVLIMFASLLLSSTLNQLESMNLIWLGQLITIIPVYYFLSRIMLLLPAASVDNLQGLSWSLSISKPYILPILMLNGVIPFAVQLAISAIPVFDLWVISIFLAFISVIVSVIHIALIAYTYQFLMDTQPQKPSETNAN